jgi:spore coat polysaccharide biosynthesis protein SpsF
MIYNITHNALQYQLENPPCLIVVQSRLKSSRFPQKAFYELAGKPLIIRVIERLLSLTNINCRIILAVPENEFTQYYDFLIAYFSEVEIQNDVIVFGGNHSFINANFYLLGGDELDVLNRFSKVRQCFSDIPTIIRVTGDNPFISRSALHHLYSKFNLQSYDIGYMKEYPYGVGVEIFNSDLLLEAPQHSLTAYDHEHVTPYLYRTTPDERKYILVAPTHLMFPNVRLTIDTKEDAIFSSYLFSNFQQDQIPSLFDILELTKQTDSGQDADMAI